MELDGLDSMVRTKPVTLESSKATESSRATSTLIERLLRLDA
jgi:hypothetical protein